MRVSELSELSDGDKITVCGRLATYVAHATVKNTTIVAYRLRGKRSSRVLYARPHDVEPSLY